MNILILIYKDASKNSKSSINFQPNAMMKKTENQEFHFHFKPVDREHRSLVHRWLKEPHLAKWFYGQGLQNTFNHLDNFLNGSSKGKYWLGCDQNRPFAFLITSSVEKPDDELTKWCSKKGEAITLDLLIGEIDYLGKGLSHIVIQEFLLSQFPNVSEVLIDPEATNSHAIHINKKVSFTVLGNLFHRTVPIFIVFIKDQRQNVLGGISGTTFYGSLYVDSRWIALSLRHQGWGTEPMKETEKIGKERDARFVTVNTMDWEALPFYKKLGYSIEFTREGYDKNSKMFMLRKAL